jgi:hypothetical protein
LFAKGYQKRRASAKERKILKEQLFISDALINKMYHKQGKFAKFLCEMINFGPCKLKYTTKRVGNSKRLGDL